ncbi:MAG TPA: hypothetical protein VNZ52_15400 [Candidatus Thermoplasmatota archaeon]|nr:hypothetical protein [Candidatus Thermoplasmatota archaeon]
MTHFGMLKVLRMRLRCAKCGSGLVPTLSGLRCPRLSACGFGGITETHLTLRPSFLGSLPPAVRA